MKRWFPFIPAALVLATALCWYSFKAGEERRLAQEWRQASLSASFPAGKTGPPATAETVPSLSENPAIPSPVNISTPGQLDKFLTDWTDKVLAEEQRLLDAKQEPYVKDEIFKTHCATLPTGDLLAICRAAPADINLINWSMSVRSSKKEIRDLLYYHAYNELTRRNPFLALQLAPNQPNAPDPELAQHTLLACANKDPEAAWRVIQEKYGGRGAPAQFLGQILRAASLEDYPARMELARKWGLLDRVGQLFKSESSETPAGQQVWISVLKETAPADQEQQVVKFTKEVENSEGFAGVQRLIGQLAEPGTPLYDSILRDAASRDLEEAAGPKADWILSQVSPAAADATAETLMRKWTETDPLPASEWLDKVPKSAPWRKAAVIAFAAAIKPHDPEAAAQWAKTAE